MTIYYIKPTAQDATVLNSIIYTNYVSDGQGGFIFPFENGTTSYIDLTESFFLWTDLMELALTDPNISSADQIFLSNLKAAAKTHADAMAAGWLPPPSILQV